MKKYRILFPTLLLLFIMIYLVSCTKPRPLGDDYQIRVLADSTIWKQTEPLIRGIFEKIEYTPQPEKLFTIIKADPNEYKRYKNLIFLSTLDAEDKLSKAINDNLSESARLKVEEGEIMFVKERVWAQDQKVMFLIAPDIQSLEERIEKNKDDIFFQFENFWRNFHEKILYSMDEQKDVEKHLLKNYGWMIRVPIDYKMVVQSARDRFVMFQRKMPHRWISIFWEEATDPNVITKEYCIDKRDSFAKSFYEKELVDEKYEPVRVEEVSFLNRRALYLKGLWSNDEKAAGGPFRMYCFFDEPTERIYFIDMHMFAPDLKKKKIHYLRQLDIIAHTFKTNLEINLNE